MENRRKSSHWNTHNNSYYLLCDIIFYTGRKPGTGCAHSKIARVRAYYCILCAGTRLLVSKFYLSRRTEWAVTSRKSDFRDRNVTKICLSRSESLAVTKWCLTSHSTLYACTPYACSELRSPGLRPEFRFPNGLYLISTISHENNNICQLVTHIVLWWHNKKVISIHTQRIQYNVISTTNIIKEKQVYHSAASLLIYDFCGFTVGVLQHFHMWQKR